MRLTWDGVGHRFGAGPWLFRGLRATFEAGASYAITGPSGSGKSTLLAVTAGWRAPSEGRVDREGSGRTSWVFQNPHGMPRRTARDHVALPLLAAGSDREDAVREADGILRRFGIDAVRDRPFRALSGGEAQRLMFARAVAARPQLLLVDEPTAQLDAMTARRINAVIGELREEGRIVLVASHDPGTVASCDHRIELYRYAVDDGGRAT